MKSSTALVCTQTLRGWNLNLREPFVNALILHELVDRTLRGDDILESMAEFVYFANEAY